jgi:tripartite-type tricarboxylate transporter receptor subunit TctC
MELINKQSILNKLFFYFLGLVGVGIFNLGSLNAQEIFPNKPIRLITLTPPGGSLDILARTIAQGLTEQLKQTILVDNKTGAGGNLGANIVAKSLPDGYTIGMVTIATHGINPSLYGNKMPFNPIKDFSPITLAAELKNILVVNPSLPIRTVQELVAYSKANPGKLSFGSAGAGTSQHLAGEMLKIFAQVDVVHVPYKGLAQAVPDLISGQIQFMFSLIPDSLPHIRSGKLRAIGIASPKRSPITPDTVPISEQGYPGFEVVGWFGVVAPAGTPKEIINRYNKEIVNVLSQSEVRERLSNMGMDVNTTTPEQFGTYISSEITKWATLVKNSGASVE